MKRIFLLLTLLSSLSLTAMLPPLGNSLRELRAVIEDHEFYQALGSGEVIQEITKTEYGYLVTTTHKQVEVRITYQPRKGSLGPAPFELSYAEVSSQ